jgi:FkbM family methyltransferase
MWFTIKIEECMENIKNTGITETDAPSIRQLMASKIERCYPFYSGCGSLANSPLTRFFSGSKSVSAWSAVTGGEVLASLDDYVGRAAFFVGDLDRKITWICKQIVREGDTCLDIGANIGIVTVLLADLVGKSGVVHSFEPNPSLSSSIQQAIRRNQINNTTVHAVALGSKNETLELIIPKGNAGAASLIRDSNRSESDIVNVPVVPLDQLCKEKNINSIRLIKIDVEGFEYEVFLGAQHVLSNIKPDAILFEMNNRTSDNFYEEPLIKLLYSFGYEFLSIPKSFVKMKTHYINKRAKSVDSHDFLAVKKEYFTEISILVNCR